MRLVNPAVISIAVTVAPSGTRTSIHAPARSPLREFHAVSRSPSKSFATSPSRSRYADDTATCVATAESKSTGGLSGGSGASTGSSIGCAGAGVASELASGGVSVGASSDDPHASASSAAIPIHLDPLISPPASVREPRVPESAPQ